MLKSYIVMHAGTEQIAGECAMHVTDACQPDPIEICKAAGISGLERSFAGKPIVTINDFDIVCAGELRESDYKWHCMLYHFNTETMELEKKLVYLPDDQQHGKQLCEAFKTGYLASKPKNYITDMITILLDKEF